MIEISVSLTATFQSVQYVILPDLFAQYYQAGSATKTKISVILFRDFSQSDLDKNLDLIEYGISGNSGSELADPCYQVSLNAITWTSLINLAAVVLLIFPAMHLIGKWGIRRVLIVGERSEFCWL